MVFVEKKPGKPVIWQPIRSVAEIGPRRHRAITTRFIQSYEEILPNETSMMPRGTNETLRIGTEGFEDEWTESQVA